jgi:hypothetical protein
MINLQLAVQLQYLRPSNYQQFNHPSTTVGPESESSLVTNNPTKKR